MITPPRRPMIGHLIVVAVLVWLLSGVVIWGAPVSYAECRVELIKWEGYKLTPYRDGISWVVGVGHSLTANGERVRPRYSQAQIERYLAQDYAWAVDSCRANIRGFDDLPEDVQLVCINLAFTVGRTGFARFKGFCLALSYRAYNTAASQLSLSRWSHQVSSQRYNQSIYVLLTHSRPKSRHLP